MYRDYATRDHHVEQTAEADVITAESVDLQKLVEMMGLLSYQDGAVPKGFLCEVFLRRTLHFRLSKSRQIDFDYSLRREQLEEIECLLSGALGCNWTKVSRFHTSHFTQFSSQFTVIL